VYPAWRTYAPLTYLPKEPPLQLALEGTIYAAGASALASRVLAERMGKRAGLWPLLAPEPLWFGHFALSLPLVWTAAYFAMSRKPSAALLAAALAAGFHIYGGVLALIYAALYGAPQLLLAAPLALLTPQSWILGHLLARIPGTDPLSKLTLLTDRAPIWLAKAGLEAAVLAAAALAALKTKKTAPLALAALIVLAAGLASPQYGERLMRIASLMLPAAVGGLHEARHDGAAALVLAACLAGPAAAGWA